MIIPKNTDSAGGDVGAYYYDESGKVNKEGVFWYCTSRMIA